MSKKLVIVETLTQYLIKYVIEVEDDIDHALDEVVMNESMLTEFSQKCLEPTIIISHKEITEEEYLKQFDEDNQYLMSWDDVFKLRNINKIDY
jgi:hypothetical protein